MISIPSGKAASLSSRSEVTKQTLPKGKVIEIKHVFPRLLWEQCNKQSF